MLLLLAIHSFSIKGFHESNHGAALSHCGDTTKIPPCVTQGHDLLPETGGGQHLEMKRSSEVLAFGKTQGGHRSSLNKLL